MPARIYDSFALLKLFQFGEIIYITKKDFGETAKLRVIRNVIQLDFRLISATDDLVYETAELKGIYAISYADAFLLATAIRKNATIVTGDPEFRNVESLRAVEWV